MRITHCNQHEIDAKPDHVVSWDIIAPGWYVWDGPNENEIISGPFPSESAALHNYSKYSQSKTATSYDKYTRERREGFAAGLNLARVIQEAGGTVPTLEALEKTTIVDFITTVAAQNNICFYYDATKIR